MSTAAPLAKTKKPGDYRLGVNSYDRASSLLISLLVMVGVMFFALVIIFFARRFVSMPVPPVVMPEPPGELNPNAGIADEPEPPGLEDAPELVEPQLMDTLTALAAVSAKRAMLSDVAIDAGAQAGKGSSLGNREAGDGGGDGPTPSREVKIEVTSADEYAAFLDFFKIELAVLRPPNPSIEYASNLSRPSPARRTGEWAAEKRLNFAPTGAVFGLCQQLASKAGLPRGALYQFYPNEAAKLLYGAEQQAARKAGREIGEIKRTVFRVEKKGSRFEFAVEQQVY